MVNWREGADIDLLDIFDTYRQPCQNTRVVAKQLQLLIDQLHKEVGVKYEDVHLIGHSLGAQIAGLTAGFLSAQIERISGKHKLFVAK